MTRYIVDYDRDAQFEECNGECRPLTELEYEENYYNDKDGNRVSYADYRRYYGNPKRHVYLYVQREDMYTRSGYFGNWRQSDALYGIDFMDDSPEARAIGTYTLEQLPGYLQEIARELV